MKGGRELDAKVTAPLFPRLHVNDAANKIGPRAPPRNKMALYEQLSIPSSAHRFKEHAAAASTALAVPVASPPLPQHGFSAAAAATACGGGAIVPVGSQGMGRTREMNGFPPYYLQQASAPLNGDIQSHSPTAATANTLRTSFASPPPKSASQTRPGVSQSADGDGLTPVKKICKRNLGNEDDFMVPTFFHSMIAQPSVRDPHYHGRCSTAESEKENAIPGGIESNENQKVTGLPQGQPHGSILTSYKNEQTQTSQAAKATETVAAPIAKNVTAGSVAKGNAEEPSRMFNSISPLNDSSMMAAPDNSVKGRPLTHLQSKGNCNADAARPCNGICPTREAGTVQPNGGKMPCLIDDDTPSTAMDLDDNERAATDSGSPILEELEENDEHSETSELDSEPSFDISPDDVVGLVGTKHFWKARRAIANQQRVFAVQVFELHRLIKVQKLIAASPQLLLDGNPCFMSSQKVPSKKKTSARNSEQTTGKDDSPKENPNGRKMGTMRVPQHSHESSGKRPFGEISRNGPHSGGNSSLFHMGSEGRPPGAWCFPPSGNQWLVPVMSASEGLVYKPYVGPCPPSGAFMAPFFGGCGSFVAAPAVGDCVRPAFGFPSPLRQPNAGFTSNPTVSPGYIPSSYGLPIANQVMSPPATEQLILPRGNSDDQSQSLSSENMCNYEVESASGHRAHGGQETRDDLHTSTASSPNARVQEGAGFPSTVVMSHLTLKGKGTAMHVHDSDVMPRVIKVVPYNRRTATESAARIFKFIQEERQHHEPV